MTPTRKHVEIVVAEIMAFRAEYKGQTVEVLGAQNGDAEVRGYFGQTWTHGGYADVRSKTVRVEQLEGVRAVLEDEREVTPEEYRRMVGI